MPAAWTTPSIPGMVALAPVPLESGLMARAGRLLGRDAELRQVDTLLTQARNGRGGALFVAGEPGIGKTALLADATAEVTGTRLLRVDGYEAESTIPFAALQRLIMPLRELLPSLSERQQQALLVAAGADGPPPDRFLVGLGALALLAAAGEIDPCVCTIDDAHLLDRESLDVLAFVARRLEAESVALLVGGRDTGHLEVDMAGVPILHLAGLRTEAAVQLGARTRPLPSSARGRRILTKPAPLNGVPAADGRRRRGGESAERTDRRSSDRCGSWPEG